VSWLENIEQRVVEAYKKTGLKPAALYYPAADGCACALGALFVDAPAECMSDLASHLGTSDNEVCDYAIGFDQAIQGRPEYDVRLSRGLNPKAYQAGRRTALAVREAGL
jgi:hypothetical protein